MPNSLLKKSQRVIARSVSRDVAISILLISLEPRLLRFARKDGKKTFSVACLSNASISADQEGAPMAIKQWMVLVVVLLTATVVHAEDQMILVSTTDQQDYSIDDRETGKCYM
jgi:hypothetical protein